MGPRTITLIGAVVALAACTAAPTSAAPQSIGGWVVLGGGQRGQDRGGYGQGYREGVIQGEQDARARRSLDPGRHREYRNADLGYSRQYGNRDVYQRAFRDGFADGYRTGFQRVRVDNDRRGWGYGAAGRPSRGGFQDAASARGYSDGFEQGLDDGRDGDRYDPVRHGDYRDADDGYNGSYGSKESYRNNYRAGFRQGYEDGYRDGARRRR